MAELTLLGLRVAREVAACGSFTAAARTLGFTQSAVSRQVAALEAAVGAPLFERTARGVRLTRPGEVLVRHANRVLDAVDGARRELRGLEDEAAGRLRVGAFPTAVAALVPRAFAQLKAGYPRLELALREGMSPTQLRRLRAARIDLAVVGSPPRTGDQTRPDEPDQPGLRLERLLEDPLLLAVARDHPLAHRGTVDLDDLADQPWVTGGDTRESYLGGWPEAEWRPRVEFVAREWTAKQGLVAAGLGVTLVPGLAASAVREDVILLRVRGIRSAVRTVSLAFRDDQQPTRLVALFAQALRQTATQMAAELQQRLR
jgi:DNA-binding transcriptional LysR family regulator